jgi:VanZ family protein
MYRILLPTAYMVCIFLLSSIPGNTPDSIPTFVLSLIPNSIQNLLHIPLFAGLSFSWIWAFNPPHIKAHQKSAALLLICISFAMLDELHQLNVPGRYASVSDLILDTIGIVSAFWLQNKKPFKYWLYK